MDMRPLKIEVTVRYLPWRGSQAAIMFLASKICCVNSGTVRALYCWLPRDVKGANPGIKKWRRGKGTMFTAILRRSAFSWPEIKKTTLITENNLQCIKNHKCTKLRSKHSLNSAMRVSWMSSETKKDKKKRSRLCKNNISHQYFCEQKP